MSSRIYVGNLPMDIKESEIDAGNFGNVRPVPLCFLQVAFFINSHNYSKLFFRDTCDLSEKSHHNLNNP